MTTHIITLAPKMFIDIETARIPYSQETLRLNEEPVRRNAMPFSEMRVGKFRKLFNRHTLAYKH